MSLRERRRSRGVGLGDDRVEAVDEGDVPLRFVVPAAALSVVGEGLSSTRWAERTASMAGSER